MRSGGFKAPKVDTRFVNNPNRLRKRQAFTVSADSYCGCHAFKELVINLLRDWGTGLSIDLYQQALLQLLGGEDNVLRSIPMKRDSCDLGQQRFAMIDDESAFRITAFSDATNEYTRQLQKLLDHSALKRIEWVNISIDRATLSTVSK